MARLQRGVALMCLVACGVPCFGQEDHESPPASMTIFDLEFLYEKHAERKQDFRAAMAASDTGDRKRLTGEFFNYWTQASVEMSQIFAAQPSTEAGKKAMMWLICNTDSDWKSHIRAAELFLAYHGAEEFDGQASHLNGFHPIYEVFLRRIVSTTSNEAVQADALLQLANMLVARSRFRELMDSTPKSRPERIGNMGITSVAFLESTSPTRDRSEAQEIYHRFIPLEQTFPEIGKAAPQIVGRDLNGNDLSLKDLRGKVVVLAFWASWCGPCLGRIPEENRLAEEFSDRPFELLGVCGDDLISDALQAVEKHDIRFRSLWNSSTQGPSITEQFGVERWPTTFVLDRSGVIRYRDLTGADLVDAINRLLMDDEN